MTRGKKRRIQIHFHSIHELTVQNEEECSINIHFITSLKGIFFFSFVCVCVVLTNEANQFGSIDGNHANSDRRLFLVIIRESDLIAQ